MLNLKFSILMLSALVLILFSCVSESHQKRANEVNNWRAPTGKVKVLSTIAMIDDLVKGVGGEYVDHLVLIKGDLDPHSYQLVKGDDEKLAFADLIFFNGLGLEHGPSLQHYLKDNAKAIGLGNRLLEQQPNLILYDHGQIDPHIWMDASLWEKLIPFVVESLSKIDPLHAAEYQMNGKQLQDQVELVHRQVKEIMHHIPEAKRYLVTSHDAFNYFARAYLSTDDEGVNGGWQKRFAAPEGLAPESQLSVSDIQAIIAHLEKYQIQVLFPESNLSRDSIRKIIDAGKSKGLILRIAEPSLYADAMGPPGSDGDTYLKMILHNARSISEHLDQ